LDADKQEIAMRPSLFALLGALAIASPASAEDGMLLSDSFKTDGTNFAEQLRSGTRGTVILINTFQVRPEETEDFKQGWTRAAEALRQQPGFVSTTLHQGIGDSQLWVNHAVWESAESFAKALASPEFRQAAAAMNHVGFRRLYKVEATFGPSR
jgi:heme-degrading monooxygenase HmoA